MHINHKWRWIISLSSMILTSLANASSDFDCININNDVSVIKDIKNKELYLNELSAEVKPFDFNSNLPYQQYVATTQQFILAKNPKAKMKCPILNDTIKLLNPQQNAQNLTVSDLVSPFELKARNNKVGVLLIHGLTDSPYLFHDLAPKFYQEGINVRTLLLPGHGTAPSALIDTSYRDWQLATRYAIQQMLNDYQQVYLGGFSTGGALIIDHLVNAKANEQSYDKIKGLLFWSPASKAKSNLAWLAQYVDYIPWVDYVGKGADIDFAKYESFPFNAGAQVHKLMNRIAAKKLAKKSLPDIPMFIATSNVDQTIASQATVDLFEVWHNVSNRSTATKDEFVLYADKEGVLTIPNGLPITKMACSDKQTCNSIVDIAHTSPTNAPSNLHYGQRGSYRNCEHILDDNNFVQCKTSDNNQRGEVTGENTKKYPHMQRLTFNPMFEQTWQKITGFIQRTSN